MGYYIKKAQETILDCIKRMPLGDILLTLAPIFMITMAISSILSIFNIGGSQAVNDFFRAIYFVYIFSMIACFATNKLTLMSGILGLKAVVFIVYIIRSGIYLNAVVNFLGYALLAYFFYYLYSKRKEEV